MDAIEISDDLPSLGHAVANALRSWDDVYLTIVDHTGEDYSTIVLGLWATELKLTKRGVRATLSFDGKPRQWGCMWSEVVMVDDGESRYVDGHDLHNLPLVLAQELVNDVIVCRESYRVSDSLVRALKRPQDFGRLRNAICRYGRFKRRPHPAIAAEERAEAAYVPPTQLSPGDVAILAVTLPTGIHGSVGPSRWTVMSCDCDLCAGGRFVAVDQPGIDGGWRHFARAALRRHGEFSKQMAEEWANAIAGTGPFNAAMRMSETSSPQSIKVMNAWLFEIASAAVRGSIYDP